MNPFKYGQIVKGEDFCRRENLEKQLISAIRQAQNLYIQGERRTGKSSLIYETVSRLKKHRLIYIDLLEVKTTSDLLKRIINALWTFERGFGGLGQVFKKLMHLRPVISVDPVSALPTMTLDASVPLKPDSLPGILDLITANHLKTKPLVVVFDEFQDILNLAEASESLAILRGKIQFLTGIPFIFAGSVRNKMDQIFTDPDSAFFKSALPIQVGALDRGTFQSFITDKFENGQRIMTPVALDKIFDISCHIPGDIQQMCSALWEVTSRKDTIERAHVSTALERIFAHESKGYETILKVVSGQQLQLMSGLAHFGGAAPTSSAFLQQSGIRQASSVRTALNRLIDLKIVFFYDDEYRFVNPFFRAWLLAKGI